MFTQNQVSEYGELNERKVMLTGSSILVPERETLMTSSRPKGSDPRNRRYYPPIYKSLPQYKEKHGALKRNLTITSKGKVSPATVLVPQNKSKAGRYAKQIKVLQSLGYTLHTKSGFFGRGRGGAYIVIKTWEKVGSPSIRDDFKSVANFLARRTRQPVPNITSSVVTKVALPKTVLPVVVKSV